MMTFGRHHHGAMGTQLCDRCGRHTRAWCTSLADDAVICRGCSLIERAQRDSLDVWAADQAAIPVVDYRYLGAAASPDLIGR